MYLPLFVGVVCWSLFWYAFYVLSSFANILTSKKDLVALYLMSFGCFVTVNVLRDLVALFLISFGYFVTVNVLCILLTVPWVGL